MSVAMEDTRGVTEATTGGVVEAIAGREVSTELIVVDAGGALLVPEKKH